MTVLFQSELMVCEDVAGCELENVVIDDSNRQIRFEFNKKVGNDLVEINPQEAEYSYATKKFSVKFKEGQVALDEEFEMKIVCE